VVDSKILDEFHMMWGSFPAPVRLIQTYGHTYKINQNLLEPANAGFLCSINATH